MEQKYINFKDALAWGQEGEKDVAIKLIERGNLIVPLYQFESDHAPILLSNKTNYVLPDIFCINENGFFWVEVKRKNQWVRWFDGIETGCDYRLYSQYLEITRLTQRPVYVFFKHEEVEPVGIYYVDVRESGRHWNGCNPAGQLVHKSMFFWSFNKLTLLP
jgi:hypothetical protein